MFFKSFFIQLAIQIDNTNDGQLLLYVISAKQLGCKTQIAKWQGHLTYHSPMFLSVAIFIPCAAYPSGVPGFTSPVDDFMCLTLFASFQSIYLDFGLWFGHGTMFLIIANIMSTIFIYNSKLSACLKWIICCCINAWPFVPMTL